MSTAEAGSGAASEVEVARAIAQRQYAFKLRPRGSLPGLQAVGAELEMDLLLPQGAVPAARWTSSNERGALRQAVDSALLDRAVHWLGELQARDLHIPLTVRVSLASVLDPDFAENIADLLSVFRVPARRLDVAVSEREILADLGPASAALERARKAGATVSIAGFAGHAPFRYLPSVIADAVIIDQAEWGAAGGERIGRVLAGLVGLAQALSMRAIVTSAGPRDDLGLFAAAGCDEVQGDAYAVAMPFGECCSFIATHRSGRGPDPFAI